MIITRKIAKPGNVFIELTEKELEQAYREQERNYRRQDAERHLLDYFDVDVDEISEDEEKELLSRHALTDLVFDDLVDAYQDTQDCNVAENDIWRNVIERYLDNSRS